MPRYQANKTIGRFKKGEIISDFPPRQIAIWLHQGAISEVKETEEVESADLATEVTKTSVDETTVQKSLEGSEKTGDSAVEQEKTPVQENSDPATPTEATQD
ncbi:hypothetical protein P255_02983 [Acinetobacter brisouii CIP 110357]|uniref:Uncharacterized protein n=1 Tax=Acinetobacter brisouii CIP 110357 TaxID=1341683 RepID=V2UG57_9GAMM|nr:hypothetical protein [Acinetobacter brisouii]ENV46184.1 hypothetical protein F954_02819 [Acinetobacter brisouii ANC 4119]ESK47501.1 hypothetical protein P255_02983 [Acinetobacter brisouii CIP 110357]